MGVSHENFLDSLFYCRGLARAHNVCPELWSGRLTRGALGQPRTAKPTQEFANAPSNCAGTDCAAIGSSTNGSAQRAARTHAGCAESFA